MSADQGLESGDFRRGDLLQNILKRLHITSYPRTMFNVLTDLNHDMHGSTTSGSLTPVSSTYQILKLKL